MPLNGSWTLHVAAACVVFSSFAAAEKLAPVMEGYPAPGEDVSKAPQTRRLPASRGMIELLNQIESLQLEVKRLRGDLEMQSHTLEQINKRQRDQYLDVDQRLQALEGRRGGGASPSLGDTGSPLGSVPSSPSSQESAVPPAPPKGQTSHSGPPEPETSATATLPPGEEEGYRYAFNLLKGGQHDESIAAFNSFLAQYPQSPHSDNAQYWLGEAYYVKRQFEPAIAEYQKLVETYPSSQKLTHALLKIGYSYQELGRIEEAKDSYQNLKSRYPGTTAARLAEERLQRLTME